MSPGQVPAQPKAYHIIHVSNLAGVIRRGGLLSDSVMRAGGGPKTAIGMPSVKQLRQTRMVRCHSNTFVAEYVPMYLCPRSIMLYKIHKDNDPQLTYHGGQVPIVHLEYDVRAVAEWAEGEGRRWALTSGNAAAGSSIFLSDLARLGVLNWEAIGATDFTDRITREGKQAEMLVHGFLAWELVERVGVLNREMQDTVRAVVAGAEHRPPVVVMRQWYY